MKNLIGIIDYGVGNLFSIEQACNFVGLKTKYVTKSDEFDEVDGLILPGVGAFKPAIDKLKQMNLIGALKSYSNDNNLLIGICLGMQLLLSKSYEFGENEGLDLIPGEVKPFDKIYNKEGSLLYPIPQIQWNKVNFVSNKSNIFDIDFDNELYMYFINSFYCELKSKDHIIASSSYANIEYPSIIKHDNIVGFQFHPEKSGLLGLNFYNWIKWQINL